MGTARNAEVLVVEPVSKRRHRSKLERRQVVEETLQPGASVAVIARRHGVNANRVSIGASFTASEAGCESSSGALVPVRVAEVLSTEQMPGKLYAGVIVVEVGRTRIRIEGAVDTENLRLALERVAR